MFFFLTFFFTLLSLSLSVYTINVYHEKDSVRVRESESRGVGGECQNFVMEKPSEKMKTFTF